ncbi:MAG: zinc ribbon domain-containing protein [Nitrospirae bacterium]|nr:MAG: zinc ribbon domain-containing protein [Nitrospirota bacterium]
MPIYEYLCQKCNKELEVVQKFSDEPLTTCPECGGELKKLISASSFILKGTGWYLTDYAAKDRKRKTEAEGNGSKSATDKSKAETAKK